MQCTFYKQERSHDLEAFLNVVFFIDEVVRMGHDNFDFNFFFFCWNVMPLVLPKALFYDFCDWRYIYFNSSGPSRCDEIFTEYHMVEVFYWLIISLFGGHLPHLCSFIYPIICFCDTVCWEIFFFCTILMCKLPWKPLPLFFLSLSSTSCP